MIKLNRIGNKLGLAGAIGVLLAIGMVANQMVTEARIEEASERAARSQQVADNSLSAHLDLRKIQLAAGDVRLARTAAEVEKTVADLQRYKASEAKELEAALATAQRPDARERLQKIKSLMEGFSRRRGRSREGADHAAGADRQALGHLGRVDQGGRGPAGFAGHGEGWTTASRSNVCCFRPTPR